MRFSTAALASVLLSIVSAELDGPYHYYSNEELTLMGCKGALFATATFCTGDKANNYKCNCKTEPALGSLIYCLYDKLGNNTKQLNKAEDWLIQYCDAVNVTITQEKMEKSYQNVTKYIVDPKKVSDFNKSAIIDYPVYYNKAKYINYYQSYKVRWRNITDSIFMGAGLIGYWAIIFVVATIYNFLNRTIFINKYFTSPFINTIRKYLVLPSFIGNKRHAHPVQFLRFLGGFLPLRIEALVLFGYFVLYFVFSGVRYHFVQNNTIWANHQAQISRYPGDRSGHLLVYSFQLTFLFIGRNNFLIWLTGWKQSTFYTYHKWVSRMNFIMLLIHAGSFHVQSITLGKFHSRILTPWYRWGIVATVAAGIMVISSIRFFRNASYEVFLLIHLVMAVIFIIGSWVHLDKFEYTEFAYCMVAIWGFDRAVRLCRLFAFGVQTARVSIKNEEILKIVVPKRKYWRPFPSAYGFVHFLRPVSFFQSHPFTIIETSETEITFYSKIKGGITSDIHRYLSSCPDKTAEIKISVEGPYGVPCQLNRYDTLILISGGTGISGPFTHALNSYKSNRNQHVKLYWIIRDIKSLDWFRGEFARLNGFVTPIVYVTKGDQLSASSNDSSNEEEKKLGEEFTDANSTDELEFIDIRYGRPHVHTLISEDLKESVGHVAVVTAAHNSVVDDVRHAVSQNLNLAKGRVDLFEELQVW